MKQKTFQFDEALAEEFELFCASRMLVEKRVVAAALRHFMQLDAAQREKVILEFEAWRNDSKSQGSSRARHRQA